MACDVLPVAMFFVDKIATLVVCVDCLCLCLTLVVCVDRIAATAVCVDRSGRQPVDATSSHGQLRSPSFAAQVSKLQAL